MHLDVIGAGPAYTDRPGATGASYLVRLGGASVLLDLGQGSFPGLAAHLDPATLDAVVISHLHPDHFIDLVALRHYLRWEKPRRRVRVIGPAGSTSGSTRSTTSPGFSAASLDVEALTEGTLRVAAFEIQAARVTHTDLELRVPGRPDGAGRRCRRPGLVYSGDCGRAEDLDVLARPGDTLLCEVSFGPGPVVPGAEHLDGPAVGDLATRGRGRPRPAHPPPDGLRPRRHHRRASGRGFDGPVELVDPGFETTHRGLRHAHKRPRHPTKMVERLDRTPLGVATHEWGGGNEPADRRPPEGSATGWAKA